MARIELRDVVKRYGGILQVGSQQRSQGNFYRACMLIRNGYIGEVTKVIGVNWAQAHWPSTGLRDSVGFFKSAISHSTFFGLILKALQLLFKRLHQHDQTPPGTPAPCRGRTRPG